MTLVGQQHMLFGAINGEIVLELQIPTDLVGEMTATAEFAEKVIKAVNWKINVMPTEYWIDSQALHSR